MLCDIILLNFLKGADQYKAKKFEEVSGVEGRGGEPRGFPKGTALGSVNTSGPLSSEDLGSRGHRVDIPTSTWALSVSGLRDALEQLESTRSHRPAAVPRG